MADDTNNNGPSAYEARRRLEDRVGVLENWKASTDMQVGLLVSRVDSERGTMARQTERTDLRFIGLEAKLDSRFTGIEDKMDDGMKEIDERVDRKYLMLDTKLTEGLKEMRGELGKLIPVIWKATGAIALLVPLIMLLLQRYGKL